MICKECGTHKKRGVIDGDSYACMDCLDRTATTADMYQLIIENSNLKREIAHARKELWMLDEEDETFLQGVEGVHFRIIGLLSEVKNLEYRLRQEEAKPTSSTREGDTRR